MNKTKDYSKIITYFKENIFIVLPMCLTALLFDGLMCFFPVIEGNTIDSLTTGDFNLVKRYCLIFVLLFLFVQFNRFCKRYLVRVFGNKMTLRMREISLKKLFTKDIEFFSKSNTGDILNRNLSDIADTTEGIRKMTTEFFDTIILLLGYLIMMFYIDYKLALLSIPFLLISILAAQGMKKVVYKYNKEYKEYLSKNKNITLTRLNNELYYRGFGVSEAYYEAYYNSNQVLKNKNTKALIYHGSLEPLYLCIAMLGVMVVVYFGGKNVINGVYLIGVLSSFLTTYALVAKKAGKVGKVFNAYQAFKVSFERCKDNLKTIDDDGLDFNIKGEELVLKNFSFEYNTGFKLPTINMNIKKGEIIGVCGQVHTGKTTLLKALCGLYSYNGTAQFDNHEITDFKDNKTQYISFCTNSISLFSDTVKNNIILAREGDFDKAIRVSALDNALDFDSYISHSNANISGGEQKRLQMARALYPNTLLILLDDPFQSVDKALARKMVNELKEYDNQIIILVSNNKDVLIDTDRIILLDDNNAYIDNYSNLLNNQKFKDLMEA